MLEMLNPPGTRLRLKRSSYNFHWWADFGFTLNGVSLMLKDQNIPEMREFETGIKFCEDKARPSLQISEEEYSSLPQDCIFTASPFFQLQKKRDVNSNIEEDTTLTRHLLSSPFCPTFTIPIAL